MCLQNRKPVNFKFLFQNIGQLDRTFIRPDRDLLRSRRKLMQQQTQLRKHMQSLLRRNGLHYKANPLDQAPLWLAGA